MEDRLRNASGPALQALSFCKVNYLNVTYYFEENFKRKQPIVIPSIMMMLS